MNNRQNNRRRGRNNNTPRQGGGGRGADPQNRIDNRTRGNAVQLHEKYRNLARDAQTKGDRVEAEYWWQFADHYYRVVADQRARAEERQGGGRSQRDEWRAQAEEDDDRPNAPSSQRDDGDGDDWRRDARGGQGGQGGSHGGSHGGRSAGQHSEQQGGGHDRARSDEEEDQDRSGRGEADDSSRRAKRPRRARERADHEDRGGDQGAGPDDNSSNDRSPDDGPSNDDGERSTRRPRRVRPVEAEGREAAAEAVGGDGDQPVKRPRGRPRKVVEPEAQLNSDVLPPSISANGEAPKRRGRPRKVVDEDTAAA